MLTLNKKQKNIFPKILIVGFRYCKNIKDYLVRVTLSKLTKFNVLKNMWMVLAICEPLTFPVDTGRKSNVHKTFRRRPGRLLSILCTFNLRPVSTVLQVEFRNGVGMVPIWGNSPSMEGWIVWEPLTQHKKKSMTKYCD